MNASADASVRRSSVWTLLLGVAIVVGVLVAVAVVVGGREQGSAVDTAGSGEQRAGLETERPPADRAFPLPPATLEGFAGAPPVDLAEFRGEPLVVNFWATWCAPCVKEMPEFQQAAGDLRGRVNFVGVNVEDAPPNAEPFVQRLGIDYVLAIDPRREFHLAVGNFGMPTTLLVDREGIVQYRYTGQLSREQLDQLLAEHLGVAT